MTARWTVNTKWKDGQSEVSTYDDFELARKVVQRRLSEPFTDTIRFYSTDGIELIVQDGRCATILAQVDANRAVFGSDYVRDKWWIYPKPEAGPLFDTGIRYHHPGMSFTILALALQPQ